MALSDSRVTLVATLVSLADERVRSLPPEVGIVELRADRLAEADPAALAGRLAGVPGELLYTLRSRAEGGEDDASAEERRARLSAAAAAGFGLIDLEAERDLHPDLLARIPPEQRLLSWHGPASELAELAALAGRLLETPARFYKLVPLARRPGEELPPLQLLATLGRRDVIAFAAGEPGVWTRLLAPRLGAPLVYGSAGDEPGAPGQPPVRRLIEDYGLPALPPVAALFGIVGNPVAHSLSPRLHNGAYRALGIPALYLPFFTESFGDFWLEVVESPLLTSWGLPLRGLSVTSPYKASALAVAGAGSPLAEVVGAANTLVLSEGVWEAESTDPEGVTRPLARRGLDPAGRAAAVYGCGGAGRAAAVGLARAGARVTLVNRGEERGEAAAAALELPFVPWAEADAGDFEILVNATSLGSRDGDPPPFDVARLAAGAVVVDMVYRGPEAAATALAAAARERRLEVVDGREVLLGQALGQFRLMTGRDLPPELGERLLRLPEAVR